MFIVLFLFATSNMILYIYYIGKEFDIERNYIISLACLEVLISLTLTLLFIYKLKQLTIQRNTLCVNDIAFSDTDNPSLRLDRASHKMINIITRYAILSTMTIIFGLFFYSVELYQIFVMKIPTNTSFSIMYGARELEALICIIVLYLSFASTVKQYYKACHFCHKMCFQCFLKSTEKTIIKQSEYHRLPGGPE